MVCLIHRKHFTAILNKSQISSYLTWTKVDGYELAISREYFWLVARNPKTLRLLPRGRGSIGRHLIFAKLSHCVRARQGVGGSQKAGIGE